MFRRFLVGIVFISLVVGCRYSPQTGGEGKLTIATLKGPSSMGMIRLIDSLSRGEGHTIQFKILNEPIQVRKMMLDGTADFAILPTTMAAIVYNKGLNYRLIAIPGWGGMYLFGSDTSVTRWEQLRGKRVYVIAKGMTPDVLFRYLLQKHGIDPEKDITLDYSFPTHIDLANAVAAGQAPLGVIAEPMVSLVMQRNNSVKVIFDLSEEWVTFQGAPMAVTAFMAKREVIQNNQLVVQNLMKSYESSVNWVNQNPDSAARLIVKYDILPDYGVAINAIPRAGLKFVRAKEVKKQIEDYLNIFYRMNPDIIGGKLPDEDFYY